MIQAELCGKLPSFENREDVLTSNVFGLLKYLPPKKSIIKILAQTKDYSKKRYSISANLKAQGINIDLYDQTDYYFWKYSPKYGEPDLILIFKSSLKKLVPLMLCIEVKYLSNKSRKGEYDQLKDYCLSLEDVYSRKTYKTTDIAEFDGLFIGIIYLTYFSQYSSAIESLEGLRTHGYGNYQSKLYELRWNEITKILKEYKSNSKYERMIVDDIVRLLTKKNFIDFIGFKDVLFDTQYRPNVYSHSGQAIVNWNNFRGFTGTQWPTATNYGKNIFFGGK
jgi:hypothetical protein